MRIICIFVNEASDFCIPKTGEIDQEEKSNDNKHQGGKCETGVVGAASSGSLPSR